MAYSCGVYGPLTSKALEVYKKLGINAVFADAKVDVEGREAVKRAKGEGLKVYACTWTFKAPNDKSRCGVENVYGERSLWAGAGCPNNPEIRESSLAWVEEVLSSLEVDGIVLDGVRFPSPGSGLSAFLTCFCEHCNEKARSFGYDLLPVKGWLKGFRDPVSLVRASVNFPNTSGSKELMSWIGFRCKSITEHVREVKNVAESVDQKAEVGAAVFAPCLAPLVGQSYADLCSILDFIQPMVYHRGDGIACVNFELDRLVEGFVESMGKYDALEALYDLLGCAPHSLPKNAKELLEKGLPPMMINEEVLRAKELIRAGEARLTPIVFIIDTELSELEEISKQALDAGPDGIVYFAFHEKLKNVIDLSHNNLG